MHRILPALLLLAASLPAQAPFRDATAEAGILATSRGRGVAVCDYNGDGAPDLFLCFLNAPNLLYANDGSGHFTEVGSATPLAASGAAMVALWQDLDGDSDPDVVVGNQDEPTRLYRNDGAGRFTEVTTGSGIALSAQVQTGVVLDYDGDGLPDLYLACLNDRNRLYRNLGNLTFQEVGEDAGAAVSGLNMQVLAFDYDADSDPDLYVVRDGREPNVLLRNDGGTFTDVSAGSGANVVGDGMGVDAADYDGDGDPDLYVTNLYANYLLENRGGGTFRERGFDTRVDDLGMGWGVAWLDYDLDGRPDLYVANETGFAVSGRRFNNVLYRNGPDGFAPVASPADSDRGSYGVATADFNADGRPDLYVANSGQAGQLFLNATANDHHWVSVEAPLHARVAVWAGGVRRVGEVRAGGSFASQHAATLHFGLGPADKVDSLLVYGPAGDTVRYYDLAADRVYLDGVATQISTGIRELYAEPMGAYPNPTTDGSLRLERPLRDIRVWDAAGRVVYAAAGPLDRLTLPAELRPGIYRLTGRGRNRIYSFGVILVR